MTVRNQVMLISNEPYGRVDEEVAEEMGDHEFERTESNPIACKHCKYSFAEHLRAAAIREGLLGSLDEVMTE